MCNVEEGEELNFPTALKKENLIGSDCQRCRINKATVLLRLKDTYCQECFLKYCTHKFRATLGKTKIMKQDENVMLAYSGGQASSCMLKMAKEVLLSTNPKRLRFNPTVLYIDESSVHDQSDEERIETYKEILNLTSQFEFTLYVVPLESIFNEDSISLVPVQAASNLLCLFPDQLLQNKIKKLFHSLKSLTSKIDLLVKLRMRLIAKCSLINACSKAFVGDSMNLSAVNVLSCVSQGQGCHLFNNIGFCDEQYEGLQILRPMREFSSKEISILLAVYKISTMTLPRLSVNSNGLKENSIQRLSQEFVSGLQDQFPSTVSTIFRTGDKLRPVKWKNDFKCKICKASVDNETLNMSANNALRFSSEISSLNPDSRLTVGNLNGECSVNFPNESNTQILCYGCRLIQRDALTDELDELLVENKEMSLKEMKSCIQDYLL